MLTRAGYAGIQRYAAVWTGDNRSFWEHMAMAIPMVLNMGLSGLAFSGPDIGGFAHHTSAQLLVRWTQMGVFFPYCRNHSSIGTLRRSHGRSVRRSKGFSANSSACATAGCLISTTFFMRRKPVGFL